MNRWTIAVAGVFMQMALGAVYTWSVFRTPLAKQFGWTISEITLTFTIAIFVLGFASFFGGLWVNRSGPRVVAVTGGILYGSGTILAGFTHSLPWLYATYGVIGGIGLGLSYIVPVAVLLKWFPDRRGLMTGIAVGGFGAGALITAPLATRLLGSVGVLQAFIDLGIGYLVVTAITGWFMQNPPADWQPAGWQASPVQSKQRSSRAYTLGEALKTWQWWVLWLLLFLNTSAGIAIISQEAPMFQELAKVTAVVAAGMVGVVAIGNAAGRVFWAWLSDTITRRWTFVAMYAIQAVLFWIFPDLHSAAILTFVSFIILLCYGGGFGTMPAFAADYFGAKNVGAIYGLLLTAWGFASVFGPLLVADLRQSTGVYRGAMHLISFVMLASIALPILARPPKNVVDAPRPELSRAAGR